MENESQKVLEEQTPNNSIQELTPLVIKQETNSRGESTVEAVTPVIVKEVSSPRIMNTVHAKHNQAQLDERDKAFKNIDKNVDSIAQFELEKEKRRIVF